MRQYNQLAMDQRYQMYAFRKAGYTKKQIAKEIGVHRSTVWREIQRNSGLRGYRPEQAQKFADKRRIIARRPIKMTSELQKIICKYLQLDWSPEQISGYLKLHYQISISHERIYQFILADKKNGGILYKHLRTKKKYKKRYGSSDKRGTIPDRVSIDQRPDIVMQKVRIGDWEGDTIIGKNHKGALVTLVERKTKFTLIAKVERKSADSVTEAIEYLFEPLKKYVFTLTVDNGKEFANHKQISNKLGIQVYFAHPYRSCERGLNENTNGLIRQYVPKKSSVLDLTFKEISYVMNQLNSRPRKSLNFDTPANLFYSCFKLQSVALQT